VAAQHLVVSPGNVSRVLDEAVGLRCTGESFDVEVAMEHPGITAALRTCAAFEERHPDPDARLAAYDDLEYHFKIAVDPREVRDVRALSRNVRAKMRDVIALASGVRVRSPQELEVLQIVFEVAFEPVFVAPPLRELPPVEVGARRDAIVVWAPHLRAGDCALYAAALEDFRLAVFIVGASGERVPGNAQLAPMEHAAELLTRAAVIVDTSTIDPGWTLALAQLGRPMAATVSAGAQAYLEGITYFRPWMRGEVARAVAQALGAPPPTVRRALVTGTSPAASALAPVGPRVALHRPGARDAADAVYEVELEAGDVPFPEMSALLANALERSGADRAEADIVSGTPGRFAVRRGDDAERVRMVRCGRPAAGDAIRVDRVLLLRGGRG
jgi:hypothetical protein